MLVKAIPQTVKEVRVIQNPHIEKMKIRILENTARQRRVVEQIGGEILRNYAICSASKDDMMNVLGALDLLNAHEVRILGVIDSLGK
jgi:CBS-domain-containing membrane protein